MNNSESPAQPVIDDCISTHNQEIFYGLTKREHFAGLAMQGLLSKQDLALGSNAHNELRDQLVSASVNIADALLKKLDNNEK